MVVLGIDPGSRQAGYGVVEVDGRRERVVDYGVLRFKGENSHQLRLRQIYERVTEVLEAHMPDECAIEMPVYGRNPQSMLKLGRAQASAMLAVLNRGLPVVEYTPAEVKKSVTGNGNASKKQVAFMVRSMLDVDDEVEMGLDASDALAVGLCHVHRLNSGTPQRHKSWSSFVKANPDRVG